MVQYLTSSDRMQRYVPWLSHITTADRYSASPSIREPRNHPSTVSSPPVFYENYSDVAHSSQRNYWHGFDPYPGSFNPLPLVPTNNINTTPEEWPPGDLTSSSYNNHHPSPRDMDPSRLTYNVADYSPVFSGVSQPSAVGEIASELQIPLQQQLLDPIEPNTARSRGKLTDHEPIQSAKPNQCLQCLQSFDTKTQLNRHKKDSKHAAFKCKCGATFGRDAELVRHLGPYRSKNPAFPCSLCTRHRGKDGFWRKDHLAQHIRTYHRITSENTSVEDRQQWGKATLIRDSPCSGCSNNGRNARRRIAIGSGQEVL